MTDYTTKLTPIHIRGKRHAPPRVKRRRQHTRSQASAKPQPSQSPFQKRKVRLSRLEDLPTEVLEVIFLYSGNVDLPLTSRGLLAQLSGQRLHKQILDVTLRPTLEADSPSEAQIVQFEAITPRRFCTWNLFHSCFPDSSLPYERLSRCIRLPVKLLHGPWTDDKIAFLQWHVPDDVLETTDAERSRMDMYDGVHDAIKEHSMPALTALRRLDVGLSLDHFHSAVIDYGCDKTIIPFLIDWIKGEALDPLDPVLWAWSTEPEQKANGDGIWLQDQLKQYSQWRDRQAPLRQRCFCSPRLVACPHCQAFGLSS